jgi:hypothetical protein
MITSFRSKDKEDGDNEQDCVKYRAFYFYIHSHVFSWRFNIISVALLNVW